MGSRYSIGLVKRDGALYKRRPAQRYWGNARFALVDKNGNVRRILEGIPFDPKNVLLLNELLEKNPTLKAFEPALKQSKEKKKQLQVKRPKNELVLVSRQGRVLKELPPTNTPVYYAIRSGNNVNVINVPMKYRGYLLKDSPRQKQRPQRFSKQRWELLQKFFKTNAQGEAVFYLDNLGRIRPPELSKGKYKRVYNEEKDKWVLKRGDGLCGAIFKTKDAQFKIWIGANFMELDVNDFIQLNKLLSIIPKNGYSKEIELTGSTVREAVRNIQLDFDENQWKRLQEKSQVLEFDFIGSFKEDDRKIGFSGGGSLKGNLFDFQKDLAKEIVGAIAQTGHKFTALNTLKNIGADNISFMATPFSANKSQAFKDKFGDISIPTNIPRRSLITIQDEVFIKLRIISQ